MKRVAFVFVFLVGAVAMASEEAHGDHIPFVMIIKQAINFLLFAGMIFFLTRKSVPAFLAERANKYFEFLNRAQKEKQAAEENRNQVRARLEKLKNTEATSLLRAESESQEWRRNAIQEAEAQAQKVRHDAEVSVQQEAVVARLNLRDQLLEEATQKAKAKLSKDLTGNDKKRLQSEFVEKIQVHQ